MEELGANVIRESTKTHLRRKLKTEFKTLLQFEDLLGNNRLFVFPENLSRIQLAKEVAQLLEHQTLRSDPSRVEAIHQVALELRESILSTKDSMSWPPKPASIDVVLDKELPIYNAGQRCGPPSRAYVEVTSSDIEANAQNKNLLLDSGASSCHRKSDHSWMD